MPTFARKNRLDAVRDNAPLPKAPSVIKHNPLRGLAVELPTSSPARRQWRHRQPPLPC